MTTSDESRQPRLVRLSQSNGLLRVKDLDLGLFRHVPLYLRSGDTFKLYKETGYSLDLSQLEQGSILSNLYIMSEDKEQAIARIQKEMVEGQLKALLRSGDLTQAKQALTSLLSEAFHDPRLRILEGFRDAVEVMVDEMSQDSAMVQAFLMVGSDSYSLAEHGINVMALLLGLARRLHRGKGGLTDLALAALLHDVGKTQLPAELHLPSRPLTDEEYARIRLHPQIGAEIVGNRGFGEIVMQGITEHHERLDGTGYPRGIRQVSLAGQAVGLANSYEALTNPLPPRPQRLSALNTLSLLKQEVEQGKHDPALFEAFAYSLTR